MGSAFQENSGHSTILFPMPGGWEQKYIWTSENITNGRGTVSVPKTVIGELMGRKGRVVNACWTHGSVSALDCVVCALPGFSASGCWRPSETPVYSCLFCSWTSTPCAFFLAVRTKLVPSVPAEWRVFTSTWMHLNPGLKRAPGVWLLYVAWKAQGDRVGEPSVAASPLLPLWQGFLHRQKKQGLITFCFISFFFSLVLRDLLSV